MQREVCDPAHIPLLQDPNALIEQSLDLTEFIFRAWEVTHFYNSTLANISDLRNFGEQTQNGMCASASVLCAFKNFVHH